MVTVGTTVCAKEILGATRLVAESTSPAACKIGGTTAVKLFETDNTCSKDGVTCILGFTPGVDVLNLCNQMVTGADTVVNGKRVAVGALLAVAHMCE